jgi:DNA-binding transcriptional MerR regulator
LSKFYDGKDLKGLVRNFIMKRKEMSPQSRWARHEGRMYIVEKVRYMISDAAQIAGVESHVLRYWEDELGLEVPRNELGHRYYTRENIQEFQRIKELKEQGYQLKAIRMILHGEDPGVLQVQPTEQAAEPSVSIAKKTRAADNGVSLSAEERMDQFRELMSDIVGRAISQNNEELSQTIGQEVQERVLKEMDYLMREQEDAAEERYKKLDAAIRGSIHKKKTLFAKDKTKTGKKEKKDKKENGKLLEQPI